MTFYNFKNWSKDGWLKEGYYISYIEEGIRYYEYILRRDLAHWEYDWDSSIDTLTESGPVIPANLEITAKYNAQSCLNQIWQLIFGIKGQLYIYVELPTDIHRHGLPKDPKPGTSNWETSHFTEWMSPFLEPSFLTEHFMMRESYYNIAFTAYNPEPISLTPTLNFFINKMQTQRIGWEQNGKIEPTRPVWEDILDRLVRRVVPSTPITFGSVSAPASV